MKLPYTLDTFSLDAWERTFGAFVKANNSHWRGAPYDAVMNLLRTKGRFEFSVTAMGRWTSRFVLTVLDDGHLDAAFVANPELPPLMRPRLEQMRQRFEEELKRV